MLNKPYLSSVRPEAILVSKGRVSGTFQPAILVCVPRITRVTRRSRGYVARLQERSWGPSVMRPVGGGGHEHPCLSHGMKAPCGKPPFYQPHSTKGHFFGKSNLITVFAKHGHSGISLKPNNRGRVRRSCTVLAEPRKRAFKSPRFHLLI